ncbi:MAG: ribosomal protein S18-alanine N-acetyltransferase [Haloarculaceae archaeon]
MTTTAPSDDPESGVTIRRAERADLLAVFHIEQEAFSQPWPFSAFESFLDEPGFLVAQMRRGSPRETATVGDDGRVVGYVVADFVPNHGEAIGHVKDIAVAGECRGEGIGRRLLGRALRTLASEGAASVKLEVRRSNDVARALYRDFGFEREGIVPRYYDNGEDALVLVREFRVESV